jgi:hypothetical protein
MIRIANVEQPDGTFAPAEPFPSDAVVILGDIEPGFYLCYQPGDELPEEPQ